VQCFLAPVVLICTICLLAELTVVDSSMAKNCGVWPAFPFCPNRYSCCFLSFRTYFWKLTSFS
jgi:hypothetical protein